MTRAAFSRIIRGRRGVTLAEVLVAAAALGILGLVLSRLIILVPRFATDAMVKADLSRQALIVEDLLSSRLRKARSSTVILDQLGPPNVTANGAGPDGALQSPYSRIRFQLATSTAPQATDPYLWIWQEGRELRLGETDNPGFPSIAPAGVHVVTKDLDAITFAYERPDAETYISYGFTLSKSSYKKRKAFQSRAARVKIMN